jgi:hypothetical protein
VPPTISPNHWRDSAGIRLKYLKDGKYLLRDVFGSDSVGIKFCHALAKIRVVQRPDYGVTQFLERESSDAHDYHVQRMRRIIEITATIRLALGDEVEIIHRQEMDLFFAVMSRILNGSPHFIGVARASMVARDLFDMSLDEISDAVKSRSWWHCNVMRVDEHAVWRVKVAFPGGHYRDGEETVQTAEWAEFDIGNLSEYVIDEAKSSAGTKDLEGIVEQVRSGAFTGKQNDPS